MSRCFPGVKSCLLVGIGGSVPSTGDGIWLGDIVVSIPSVAATGIVAYDMVKRCQGVNSR
jgi:hypothetical protein